MNHLWPLITQSSPSFTAFVWMSVGSEPATSGSVIAKQERARPSASGRRYRSFCSGVAQWRSVCMLPSSGAWALMTNGPMPVRPASAETNAIATAPRPMPSHSAGRCGFQRPSPFAFSRRPTIVRTYSPRSAPFDSSFCFCGADLGVHELAHLEADFLDIGRESEIDGHSEDLLPVFVCSRIVVRRCQRAYVTCRDSVRDASEHGNKER